MAQLRESMPESVRPYAPLDSLTLQTMTVLTAGTDRLISGSPDGHVNTKYSSSISENTVVIEPIPSTM